MRDPGLGDIENVQLESTVNPIGLAHVEAERRAGRWRRSGKRIAPGPSAGHLVPMSCPIASGPWYQPSNGHLPDGFTREQLNDGLDVVALEAVHVVAKQFRAASVVGSTRSSSVGPM